MVNVLQCVLLILSEMRPVTVPENATLVQQFDAAYVFLDTVPLEMDHHSKRITVGFPVTIISSIIPKTKTTRFAIEAAHVPGVAHPPVLFLRREMADFVGMKLRGWDHVFWMSDDYHTSDDFVTACTILRDDYKATSEQIVELAVAVVGMELMKPK